MIETDSLAAMFAAVSLNKTIMECVVNVKDEVATVYAIDLTESVFVQTSTKVTGMDDIQFGIGSLDTFVKYLNMIRGISVKMSIKGLRLNIVPKKGSRLSYLLAETDMIPTYDDSFLDQGDVIAREFDDYDYGEGIPLKQENISELLQLTSLLDPNSIVFEVNTKGKLNVHTGNETEHQVDITFGKTSCGACSNKLYGKHITSIFSLLEYDQNPMMYISDEEGSSIVIKTDTAGWILQQITTPNE